MKSILIFLSHASIALFCVAGIYQAHEKAALPARFAVGLFVSETVDGATFLSPGDTVQTVNGQRVSSADEVEFLLDAMTIGEPVTLTVERRDAIVTGREQLVPFFSLRYLVIQTVVTAVFIFLALFVAARRKHDAAAQVFQWVLLFTALIIATTWGNFTRLPYGAGYLLRAVFTIAYAGAGVLFLHFTLVFPSQTFSRRRRAVYGLYAAAGALALVSIFFFLRAAPAADLAWFRVYNGSFNAIRIVLVLCVIVGLAMIVRSYLGAREESERRKLRWILLGLFVGPFVFVAFWIVPQVIRSRGLVDEEIILLAMLSVPVTFSIAIVKYHVLNIDRLFNRTTVYALVFALVLAIYAAIVGAASFVIGSLTVSSSLAVSTVAAVTIAVLFQPIRTRTQKFVDRVFFNVRYNYREAENEFMETIQACYDERTLRAALVDAASGVIPNLSTRVVWRREHAMAESIAALLSSRSEPLGRTGDIEPGARFIAVSERMMEKDDAAVFRIWSDVNGLWGALVMGKKRSGFRYTLEDIDLLQFFCRHAALAFDRVSLQHSLMAAESDKTRLKELNELKSLFISSVTHELKTPLTSIRLFSELMMKPRQPGREKRCEYLSIIQSESQRLNRLIDNVLDSAKIEKGVKDFHFAPMELNSCVEEALRTMQYQLSLHGFECRTQRSARRLELCADRDAVLGMLIDLISNAIKYSPKKKRIVITTRHTDNGAELSVRDSGAGIARHDLEKIFEPFERTDSPLAGQTTGTGLGLSLVRHIAEAHHALLRVESEPGKGTVFTVTFPFTTHVQGA